jgi:hypothetical protein
MGHIMSKGCAFPNISGLIILAISYPIMGDKFVNQQVMILPRSGRRPTQGVLRVTRESYYWKSNMLERGTILNTPSV